MKYFLFTVTLIFTSITLKAQKEGLPVIGAQIFLEPGQTNKEVENWFKILNDQGMKVCRVFLMETHMHRLNGTWDFELYDFAFKTAEKYHIKIFATLYPKEVASDWRLEKLPQSKVHLASLKNYIEAVTLHFSKFTSLYSWVIQNEPGAYGMYSKSDLSDSLNAAWNNQKTPTTYVSKGYKVDNALEDKNFQRKYVTWYLSWITNYIHSVDTTHEIHVNNQDIFYNIPELDFVAWRKFITIFGASCHPSWHYTFFDRNQYSMLFSANCDLIRFGAGDKPFLITELQGGNNTYSGFAPMCPTKEEITQWLWISIGAGSKGTIFWTLNPRAVGGEAGEWGMINFQQKPTDRLLAAGHVANELSKDSVLFANAKPYRSPVFILYSKESFWIEKLKSDKKESTLLEGRTEGAMIKSVLSWYEALSQSGINANLGEIGSFNWEKPNHDGEVIILSHQLSIPSFYWEKIRHFVKSGGKLIVDGLTFFFDENHLSLMQTGFPLEDVMGGSLSEVVTTPGNFTVKMATEPLPAHLFEGFLNNKTGKVLSKEGDRNTAILNHFGKGTTIWIPSMIGLGAKQKDSGPLARFLNAEVLESTGNFPIRFKKPEKSVLMRTTFSGSTLVTIIINKSPKNKSIPLVLQNKSSTPRILVANKQGSISGNIIHIKPEETMVIKWKGKN